MCTQANQSRKIKWKSEKKCNILAYLGNKRSYDNGEIKASIYSMLLWVIYWVTESQYFDGVLWRRWLMLFSKTAKQKVSKIIKNMEIFYTDMYGIIAYSQE